MSGVWADEFLSEEGEERIRSSSLNPPTTILECPSQARKTGNTVNTLYYTYSCFLFDRNEACDEFLYIKTTVPLKKKKETKQHTVQVQIISQPAASVWMIHIFIVCSVGARCSGSDPRRLTFSF